MMSNDPGQRLHVALVHHPVVNKIGETIGSAVTNLDLHDIARTARTYGVAGYSIITPYSDQQELVAEILDHWKTGHGAQANPARKEALECVDIKISLDEAVDGLQKQYGSKPLLMATSAVPGPKRLGYRETRAKLDKGELILLLFGTAHGLAKEVMERVDYLLPPIQPDSDYNHLSVRSAASIILDRLLGEGRDE
ncbi:MAG: RNA methyltransferase [Thermodesulfobacteriota bacterium]